MSIYSLENPKSIARTKCQRTALKQLHIYGIFATQVVAWGILMAVVLWLLVSFPEPEVRVTSFVVDSILGPKQLDNTLLHYDITVRNPDLYKSIHYDILVLRMTNSQNVQSKWGATITYNKDGKGITQKAGETTHLGIHTVDYYLDPKVNWYKNQSSLKGGNSFIKLKFVMDVRFMAFNRVVGSRQLMRIGDIYFNDTGYAFINSKNGGFLLK